MNVISFVPPAITPPRRFNVELSETEASMLAVILNSYYEFPMESSYSEKQLDHFIDELRIAVTTALK